MKYLIILFFLIKSLVVISQTNPDVYNTKELNSFRCDSTKVIHNVLVWEKEPLYKAGNTELIEHLNNQLTQDINYPKKINVRFMINCKGEIAFVSPSPEYRIKYYFRKREWILSIKKALQNSGEWIPAISNGTKVDAVHELSFKFKKGEIVQIFNTI